MAVRVTCPSCRTVLTVSDAAPLVLTCPRCLAKIQRPPSTGLHTPPPIPLRALPLDAEVEADSNIAYPVIALIGIFVVLGFFIIGSGAPPEMKPYVLAIVSLLAAGAIAIGALHAVKRKPIAEAKMVDTPATDSAAPPTLNYSSVRRQPRDVAPTKLRWFVGGFFIALGICAGGFILLAVTAGITSNANGSAKSGGNFIYLLVVLLSVVGLIWMSARISHNPRMRGFGLGATVGLCLGMLALGPCAFCYLITLN